MSEKIDMRGTWTDDIWVKHCGPHRETMGLPYLDSVQRGMERTDLMSEFVRCLGQPCILTCPVLYRPWKKFRPQSDIKPHEEPPVTSPSLEAWLGNALARDGYDGLYDPSFGCGGCARNKITDCSAFGESCQPAWALKVKYGSSRGWTMTTEKPAENERYNVEDANEQV